MTKTTVWRPVEFDKAIDGYNEAMAHYVHMIGFLSRVYEKPKMAVCQQVEVDATVPDDVRETIRLALNESAEDIGLNRQLYAEPDAATARMDAALAWLDSLAKGGDNAK